MGTTHRSGHDAGTTSRRAHGRFVAAATGLAAAAALLVGTAASVQAQGPILTPVSKAGLGG